MKALDLAAHVIDLRHSQVSRELTAVRLAARELTMPSDLPRRGDASLLGHELRGLLVKRREVLDATHALQEREAELAAVLTSLDVREKAVRRARKANARRAVLRRERAFMPRARGDDP